MAAPPYNSNAHQLRNMLQASVQAVQWTYSLFWQLCPRQRVLVWGDGYYNGAIKTRKTVHVVEVNTEEASLERSQQLRELYDSLSAGDLNHPTRRPAALSPEDLTESEWFYLMCVSFSFPLGIGLPGKAYVKRQHLWLKGANEGSSKLFTRAILAKSAGVQTVVCIPLLDGVVELGTTDRIEEKIELIQQVKSFFINCINPATQPPKPALSEHSTSNLISPSRLVEMDDDDDDENDDDNDDEDDVEEEDEEGDGVDSEAETGGTPSGSKDPHNVVGNIEGEPSQVMLLDMSHDSIRLGSPENGSNNLDSGFDLLKVSQPGIPVDPYGTGLKSNHAPLTAFPLEDELPEDDIRYSQTVTTILHRRNFSGRSSDTSSVVYSIHSPQSSFSICTAATTSRSKHNQSNKTSQYILKYMLFTIPYLHSKPLDETAADLVMSKLKKSVSQEELSANHVLAERRRREKLNERFIILRSLVPFVTKMDKASILGDTIEYVKQLRKKIHDLEAREHHVDEDTDCVDQRLGNCGDSRRVKRKMRVVERGGRRVVKAAEIQQETVMEVSIIENDGLVEVKCPYKEGLLLDVMMKLREFRMEITAVHSSSSSNGGFVAELRTKVKENVNGKKASITEVKKAIKNIIPLHP